ARLTRPDSAHRVELTADELGGWAEECHLAGATPGEKDRLTEALTADDRRGGVAPAPDAPPREGGPPARRDVPPLLGAKDRLARIGQAERLGLPTVVQAVAVTEQFHEAALAVFQCLLWWGTQRSGDPVDQLLTEGCFAGAAARSRETARALLAFRTACDRP